VVVTSAELLLLHSGAGIMMVRVLTEVPYQFSILVLRTYACIRLHLEQVCSCVGGRRGTQLHRAWQCQAASRCVISGYKACVCVSDWSFDSSCAECGGVQQ
jgi:hypothetical protein